MRNYRNQLEHQNEIELKDIENRYASELQKLHQTKILELDQLTKAYDVKISEEAEIMEDRLSTVHAESDKRITTEKQIGEDELKKVKLSNRQRVEDYKKYGELQLESLKKQIQADQAAMHDRAVKAAKKEREQSNHES